MGAIADKFEVVEAETEEVLPTILNHHARQLAGLAGELFAQGIDVVVVDVDVATGPDEVPGREAGDLGDHHRQQAVGGDVEGNTQADIAAALVELAVEAAVGDLKLEQAVARGQGHVLDLGRVPGGDDHTAAVRIRLDQIQQIRDLIDGTAIGRRPRAPLTAVHGTEVTVLVSPLVPDPDAILLEVADVGVAGQEPEQLMDDGLEVQLLGGHAGKAVAQVEAHLVAEDSPRAGAGPIGTVRTVIENMLHEIEIWAHGRKGDPVRGGIGARGALLNIGTGVSR